MKLLVCTNFSQPFHTGGAERVVQQITETLTKKGFTCVVFCQHGSSTVLHNGVKVVPVGNLSEQQFIEKVIEENADHLFVYSDWFFMWPAILKNINRLSMKKSIGLVGMNRMRSSLTANAIVAELFRKNHESFKVLAHAENYIDVKVCKEWGIPVSIIHNAIDLNEFVKSDFDFKKHYGIKTNKVLLCVSNFFPGKGLEYIPQVLSRLYNKHKDFTFVFISSTLAFQPGNRLRAMVKENCEKMNLPVRFLNDIPREHVVQSYFASDIFVFPSQQECGPIVVLEAMAAKKPWVAMNVGHIADLRGGLIVYVDHSFDKMISFGSKQFADFYTNIDKLLSNEDIRKVIGEEGRSQIEKDYNWNAIGTQYASFFMENK